MINGQAAMAMQDSPDSRESSLLVGRLIGLSIIAVAPTMFWTTVLYLGALAYGQPLSIWASAVIASIMFGFLTCIWASFALSDRRAPDPE